VAVDTQKLFYLLDPVFQIENLAGKPVVGGHIEVFIAGTDTKYITWQDWDGARNPFKIPLKSDGRAVILVEPQYTYDVYVYDSFNNMVCSRLNVSPAIGGDVSVSGLTQVFHDETISGNGTPQEPIGVVSAGKVYQGIEPIVVNNDLDKISANHVPLGVQEPLYFVQDDEEGCIIGFSGQTIPEGVMSESGLGFENDKITGYNGSAFSAGNEYEAGSYVDITDNTISVTGLPTSADVQNIVDVATSGLMPSGDYLTKESADTLYAPTGNYLTGLPDDLVYSADITGFATTAQLDEKLDKSDSGNFYPMDSNPSGYINELPSDLATTGWVDSQGYLTAVDIPESATWNATTQTVSANSAQWAGGTANPQIPVTGINGIKISESGDKVVFEVSADYAEKDWVTAQGYLTAETDWTDTITAASANAYEQATAAIPPAFDPSYISAQVDTKLNSAIYAADSGTFLTALPQDLVYTADIADMATTGDLTGKQDITGMTAYATVESLTAKQDAGDYLSATDSANFLLTSDSGNFYPMNENPSGYLTAHQDLSDYQTTAGMTAYQPAGDYLTTADSANFLTAVPDTYLQNTDLTINDGKITEISGVPLSAGDELPSGLMNESAVGYDASDNITGYNGSAFFAQSAYSASTASYDVNGYPITSYLPESGVGYNAVQEISAINGSAIAQYGHEAQWLVHDDTLVHASNSAQYALGVNLSAVAQLLGIDETVLWSGNTGSNSHTTAFTLSESFSSFKRIRFEGEQYAASTPIFEISTPSNLNRVGVCFEYYTFADDSNPYQMRGGSYSATNGLDFTLYKEKFLYWANTGLSANGGNNTQGPNIRKIVGIGRKS